MKPGGGGEPSGKIAELIKADLGGFDQFVAEFKNAGATQFGSGWAWLGLADGKLRVTKTPNAENPLTREMKPSTRTRWSASGATSTGLLKFFLSPTKALTRSLVQNGV